jgi:hypothetical protein
VSVRYVRCVPAVALISSRSGATDRGYRYAHCRAVQPGTRARYRSPRATPTTSRPPGTRCWTPYRPRGPSARRPATTSGMSGPDRLRLVRMPPALASGAASGRRLAPRRSSACWRWRGACGSLALAACHGRPEAARASDDLGKSWRSVALGRDLCLDGHARNGMERVVTGGDGE